MRGFCPSYFFGGIMDIIKKWFLRIDIEREFDTPIIELYMQDVKTNLFITTLTNNGARISLKDYNIVTLNVLKADDTKLMVSGKVTEDGNVIFEMDSQATSVKGICSATIRIYEGDSSVTSKPFYFSVIDDPYRGTDNSIVSQNSYTALQNILSQTAKALEEAVKVNDYFKLNLPTVKELISYEPILRDIVKNKDEAKELIRESKNLQVKINASMADLKRLEGLIPEVNRLVDKGNETIRALTNATENVSETISKADLKKSELEDILSKFKDIDDKAKRIKAMSDEVNALLPKLDEARSVKSGLDSTIASAKSNKTDLEKSITSAGDIDRDLGSKIDQSKTLSNNLKADIENAKNTNATLNNDKEAARLIVTELKNTKNDADVINSELNSTKIKADSSKTELEGLIANSNKASTEARALNKTLGETNTRAESNRSNLDSANTKAEGINNELRDLVMKSSDLETSLKEIIASGDLSKYVTDPKLQEALKAYAKLEDISASKLISIYECDRDFWNVVAKDKDFANTIIKDMFTLVVFVGNKARELIIEAGFETALFYKGNIVGFSPIRLQDYDGFDEDIKNNSIKYQSSWVSVALLSNYNKTIQVQLQSASNAISEIKTAYAKKSDVSTKLSELEDDENHRLVTDEDIDRWNKKFGKDEVNKLIDKRVKEEAMNPKPKIMTAVIDQSNSNPLTCVTYEDDAKTMEKGSSEWDKFFGAKLVLFKDGKEVRDLEDSELDSLKPEDGDVMVKFKRMGLNIKTVGDKVYVSMTNDPGDENFKYYAHTRGPERREAFYLGAYLGYEENGKLRSIKDVMPTYDKTIGAFRNLAQANGKGYEQFAFYQLVFLQAMYVLKYGNLDSQTAIGKGLTGGSYTNTGTTNGKGIDFGSTDATLQMRFQYLEDLYGNKMQFIEGTQILDNTTIINTTDNYNDEGKDYKTFSIKSLKGGTQFPKKIQGTSELGFIAKEVGASETTYFCDAQIVDGFNVYVPIYGGAHSVGDLVGIFALFFNVSVLKTSSITGSRLMFL